MTVKRITISDVATASGVSVGAVSRILNNDPTLNVREETKQTVLQAIAKLGYSPNPQARGLRMARSGSIAMIVPEINSPAFPAIIQGAQKAARELGYSMLLGGIGEEGEDPQLAARILASNRVDGFLISTGAHETEQLRAVKALKAPSVLVNRYLDELQPYVVLDDVRGAQAIVEHLIELGHKRIAYLGALRRFLGTRRLAGYKAALKGAGLRYDPRFVIESAYDRESGESGVVRLMALEDRPTAIFATNHLVAAGAMGGAQRRGLTVPDDLSVASFYDGPIAELLNPAMTSVLFPLDRLGYESVSMLAQIVAGKRPASIGITIPHDRIVVRQSTAKPPAKIKKTT
jgi:DNA-binding LacI/PurR family transcriptional regulator